MEDVVACLKDYIDHSDYSADTKGDYKGFLCIKGEEFLGIDTENYDVVKATQKTRNASEGFPHDMYVIEKMAIDGILLLQKETGEIYTYQPNLPLRKVADSFAEYLLAL